MDRLRADLIRRARLERQATLAQDAAGIHPTSQWPQMAQVSGNNSLGNLASAPPRRPILSRLVSGRRREANVQRGTEESNPESPKSPEFNPPRQTYAASSIYSASDRLPSHPPHSHVPSIVYPPAAVILAGNDATGNSHASGVPQHVMLATSGTSASQSEVQDGHRSGRSSTQGSGMGRNQQPKRFLFCFPWVKSHRLRTHILRCFVSGMFLGLLLSVYLGLSVTKHIARSEMNIMMILIILFATILFCYNIMRLCIVTVRGDRERAGRQYPARYGHAGYVIPRKPIRVVLVQDEEAVGVESETTTLKPPAYGLWRESVRVDPNRFFWQRNEAADPMPQRSSLGPRPPSYASDDGVSYVVEAAPRSTIQPAADVSRDPPLPPHPSEVGRAVTFF